MLPEISQDLRDILKKDIIKRGRIVVPVIKDELGNILDGKIRQEIADELGYKNIPTITLAGLSDQEKQEVRVIFNLARRQMTREQIRGLIEWELRTNPTHSDRMVAKKLGTSPTNVGKVRSTVQSGQLPLRLGADGKYRRPVVYTTRDRQTKEVQAILQDLETLPTDEHLSMRKLRRQKWEQDREQILGLSATKARPSKNITIHCCDFRKLGDLIKPGFVDLIITDPPWGEWKQLAQPLAETICRLLRPNGVACLYPGMLNDDQWHDAMRRAGLKKELRIASLHETLEVFSSTDAIRHCYTEIIVYRWKPKGTLRTNFPLPDVIHSGIEKDRHEWQQPISDSVKLIQCLSRPGETVCDLCVGSGTVPTAVAQVGGRKFVGGDIEQKLVNSALGRATG